MSINRNNYETYFLLYVDNELSAIEKNEVDQFVQQHADLKKELLQLQQTIMVKNSNTIFDTSFLIKDENQLLQQKLLLLIDNQLPQAEKNIVEKLLLNDTDSQQQFKLLQRTILPIENEVFLSDKTFLYKKEKGRVVGFGWFRMIAAAVFVGICVTAGWVVFNNFKTSVVPTANIDIIANQPNNIKNNAIAKNNTTPSDSGVKANELLNLQAPNTVIIKNNKEDILTKENNSASTKTTNKLFQKNANTSLQIINNAPSNEIAIANVNNKTSELKLANNTIAASIKKMDEAMQTSSSTTQMQTQTLTAINTSYTDAAERNDDRILYVPEEKISRSKLGSFIKKAKSLIAKSTTIKTGNSIKVAGFDIAIN
jgi:hypothetical protein